MSAIPAEDRVLSIPLPIPYARPVSLPPLDAPPIFEVICGISFDPLPLDPMVLGTYWKERRSEFPGRQLHPAISDGGVMFFGAQTRVWLIGMDDDLVLQLQPDRFYLNWRLRGTDYPRFSDHPELGPARAKGLLSRAVDEFALFGHFCEREVSAKPTPRRVELGKVDRFVERKHWAGLPDLAKMLPWFQSFANFHKSDAATIGVQFGEPRAGGELQVVLASAFEPVAGAAPTRFINLETRLTMPLADGDALRSTFETANAELNAVFENLIPAAEYGRFRKGGSVNGL